NLCNTIFIQVSRRKSFACVNIQARFTVLPAQRTIEIQGDDFGLLCSSIDDFDFFIAIQIDQQWCGRSKRCQGTTYGGDRLTVSAVYDAKNPVCAVKSVLKGNKHHFRNSILI